MPLEVNEIGIRLSVGDGEPAQAPEAPGSPPALSGLERTALVEECVRRVLEELKRMQER